MAENKFNFTVDNLKNILESGNQQLVNFTSKAFILKTPKAQLQNKIKVDENGKLYTQKDGVKSYRISKQKYGLMPNFCPICGKLMGKHPHDSFFWGVHKRCYRCSIDYEAQMKEQGTFDAFALGYMRDKLVDTCNQAILFYQQSKHGNQRQVLINQQGDTQTWAMENKQQFNNAVNKVIEQLEQYRDTAIKYFEEKLNEIEAKDKKL